MNGILQGGLDIVHDSRENLLSCVKDLEREKRVSLLWKREAY